MKNEERQNVNQETHNQHNNRIRDELQALLNDISTDTVEEKWNTFKSIMYKISKEKLSTAVRKHKDWFDRNSMGLKELVNKKNLARNNMLSKNIKSAKARYRTCRQLLQCKELKNKWWLTKVAELQTFAVSTKT